MSPEDAFLNASATLDAMPATVPAENVYKIATWVPVDVTFWCDNLLWQAPWDMRRMVDEGRVMWPDFDWDMRSSGPI